MAFSIPFGTFLVKETCEPLVRPLPRETSTRKEATKSLDKITKRMDRRTSEEDAVRGPTADGGETGATAVCDRGTTPEVAGHLRTEDAGRTTEEETGPSATALAKSLPTTGGSSLKAL